MFDEVFPGLCDGAGRLRLHSDLLPDRGVWAVSLILVGAIVLVLGIAG
ncbi:hypothetical protein V1283_001463 [Bradyrhizobium sp. AZCC 2262]